MIKKNVFSLLLLLFLTTPLLGVPTNGDGYSGGQVYYERVSGYFQPGSIGGEFTIRSDGGPGLLLTNAAYAPVARPISAYPESFQTFCVERREYVHQPMEVWVSMENLDGSKPGSHAWYGGTGAGDDLNPQTAYLYHQFATGNLSNYTYISGGARGTSADNLQNAIWFFEGEIGSVSNGSQAELWVQEAVNATGVDYGGYTHSGTATWGNTIGLVRILQMHWCGTERQDQLYLMIPAPGAILLSGIGLCLVGWLRRRRTL